MRRIVTFSLVGLLCLFLTLPCQAGPSDDMAAQLLAAHQKHQPIPVLTLSQPSLTTEEAYQVQLAYLTQRLASDSVGGFKAGLTTLPSQKRFGVPGAVSGVLYASGCRQSPAAISAKDFIMPMIETEIAFVIDKPITAPVTDVLELQQYVGAVMPAIELPDLGFADMASMKGTDLIAANVSAVQYITGPKQPVWGSDLNSVRVKLTCNGQVINEGTGSEAMGDQWQAALWLVNQTISQGWTIQPGQILMTGALGQMLPGKPGHYTADYGSFGQIQFDIQ